MNRKNSKSSSLSLNEYLRELLSFLKDGETIADKLSQKYGTLYRLTEASAEDIATCSESCCAADVIKLSVALTARRVTDTVKVGRKYSREKIEEYIKWLLFGLPHETVYLLLFDSVERLISCEYVGEGVVNASSVLPRKLIDLALSKKAKSVILAHNHPDGFLKPSKTDLDTTEALRAVLKNSGIDMLSHYIVADGECADIILRNQD